MGRPFPVQPRGPRHLVERSPQNLFGCPRYSPEWELAALRALMKPQMKTAIEHRSPEQKWPADGHERVMRAVDLIEARLGTRLEPRFPESGEFFMLMEVLPNELVETRAFAVVLSQLLPENWFVLNRLFVMDGKFYRRERGYKLVLRVATDVHLPRAVRAAINDIG